MWFVFDEGSIVDIVLEILRNIYMLLSERGYRKVVGRRSKHHYGIFQFYKTKVIACILQHLDDASILSSILFKV